MKGSKNTFQFCKVSREVLRYIAKKIIWHVHQQKSHSFHWLVDPVKIRLWQAHIASALCSHTLCFAWRPHQTSGTPGEARQRGGSWQSRCIAGPAHTAWRSHTGSGGWREATPPGPAVAGTSWPSPAIHNSTLSNALTPFPVEFLFGVIFFYWVQNAGLTALRVRSHWDTISLSCVMISLLVLARSTLFSLTSTWHALQCSLASSACQSVKTFVHFFSQPLSTMRANSVYSPILKIVDSNFIYPFLYQENPIKIKNLFF